MGAIPKQRMTLEEYLEFDANTEGRFEYYNGEIFEMGGGSPEHSLLGNRMGRLLGNKLESKGCSVYNSEVLIKVPAMPP